MLSLFYEYKGFIQWGEMLARQCNTCMCMYITHVYAPIMYMYISLGMELLITLKGSLNSVSSCNSLDLFIFLSLFQLAYTNADGMYICRICGALVQFGCYTDMNEVEGLLCSSIVRLISTALDVSEW